MKLTRILMLGLIAIGAMVLAASPALADKIVKKDGSVLEGEIVKEADTYVFINVIVGGVERQQLVARIEIERIERDDAPGATEDADYRADTAITPAPREREQTTAPSQYGATRVAFISLRGEVGLVMNGNALLRAAEELEDDEVDVLVLVINSGGGFLSEIEPLSDAIHEELKQRYRVVAWIESAISAACMTAWNCEEIYMTKQGALGGNVAFIQKSDGTTEAASGEDLRQILRMGQDLSRRGNRDPLIMQAMQNFSPLSCDIDENGILTWFESTQGEHLVNPENRILTFNSVDAERYGVSMGTADTKNELMSAMGISEWVEVGQDAEKHMVKFREGVEQLQRNVRRLLADFTIAMDLAEQGDEDLRKRGLGKARSILRQLQSMVRRAPSFEEYTILTPEWFAEREQEIRELARRNR